MDSFQVIVNQWIESMEKVLSTARNLETKRIGGKIIEGFKQYIEDESILEIVEKARKEKIKGLVKALSEIALAESCIAFGLLKASESYNVKDLRKRLADFLYTNLYMI